MIARAEAAHQPAHNAVGTGTTASALLATPCLNGVLMAIDSVEREERLRSAMTLAASRDAEKMEALRLAVCEFTFAHRADGLTPEGVLIALKS